jgi:hypothetical protein
MFRHLLGLGSFDNPKGLLACKQVSLLIIFGNIGFILTTTITPTSYLRNWILVVTTIVARFKVNQHLFLLEALA